MQIRQLPLKGLLLITPTIHRDLRGFFFESYNQKLYNAHGLDPFVQDNHSYSLFKTLRGLHFQKGEGQAKLVRCALGKVFDVAVDIRPDSPTFGQWEGVILDGEQHQQLYIPPGFAHGFCVVSPHAHLLYKVSTPYNPQLESEVRWNDPDIGINWPFSDPLLSERDRTAQPLSSLRGVQ